MARIADRDLGPVRNDPGLRSLSTEGRLYTCTWPNGSVYRYDVKDNTWTPAADSARRKR